MDRVGYQITADFEASHWWFSSRRELVMLQLRRAADELTSTGNPSRRPRLLDYGCGTGFNLPFFAELGDVVGADLFSEVVVEHSKATNFPRIDLRKDREMGEHHARFDIVTALDVLEHIADDVDGLRRMTKFVVPGGQIILTVPAYRWLWSGEDVLSQHERRYTRESLLACCRAAELEVLYVSYFNLTVLPAMAAVIAFRRSVARARATGQRPRPRSNVGPVPAPLNEFLRWLTTLEARWVGGQRRSLPAGPSLVCRLRAGPGNPSRGEAKRRGVKAEGVV